MVKTFNKDDRILWLGDEAKTRRRGANFRPLILYGLILSLLIVGSLFYVWSRIQVIQLGYEISIALKEEKKLIETNKRLHLEVATLKSYSRIEKIAVEELGMRKPKPDQVIVIR